MCVVLCFGVLVVCAKPVGAVTDEETTGFWRMDDLCERTTLVFLVEGMMGGYLCEKDFFCYCYV